MPRMAVRSVAENSEASILQRYGKSIPHEMGPFDDRCSACGALRWKVERKGRAPLAKPHAYSNCCHSGEVKLPETYFKGPKVPSFIKHLLTSLDPSKPPSYVFALNAS